MTDPIKNQRGRVIALACPGGCGALICLSCTIAHGRWWEFPSHLGEHLCNPIPTCKGCGDPIEDPDRHRYCERGQS
jgi:hypothetical protein